MASINDKFYIFENTFCCHRRAVVIIHWSVHVSRVSRSEARQYWTLALDTSFNVLDTSRDSCHTILTTSEHYVTLALTCWQVSVENKKIVGSQYSQEFSVCSNHVPTEVTIINVTMVHRHKRKIFHSRRKIYAIFTEYVFNAVSLFFIGVIFTCPRENFFLSDTTR